MWENFDSVIHLSAIHADNPPAGPVGETTANTGDILFPVILVFALFVFIATVAMLAFNKKICFSQMHINNNQSGITNFAKFRKRVFSVLIFCVMTFLFILSLVLISFNKSFANDDITFISSNAVVEAYANLDTREIEINSADIVNSIKDDHRYVTAVDVRTESLVGNEILNGATLEISVDGKVMYDSKIGESVMLDSYFILENNDNLKFAIKGFSFDNALLVLEKDIISISYRFRTIGRQDLGDEVFLSQDIDIIDNDYTYDPQTSYNIVKPGKTNDGTIMYYVDNQATAPVPDPETYLPYTSEANQIQNAGQYYIHYFLLFNDFWSDARSKTFSLSQTVTVNKAESKLQCDPLSIQINKEQKGTFGIEYDGDGIVHWEFSEELKGARATPDITLKSFEIEPNGVVGTGSLTISASEGKNYLGVSTSVVITILNIFEKEEINYEGIYDKQEHFTSLKVNNASNVKISYYDKEGHSFDDITGSQGEIFDLNNISQTDYTPEKVYVTYRLSKEGFADVEDTMYIYINKAISHITCNEGDLINVEQYGDDKTLEVYYDGDGVLGDWQYDTKYIDNIEKVQDPDTCKYLVKIKHNQALDTPIFSINLGIAPASEKNYILDKNLEIGLKIVEDAHITVNNCDDTYDKEQHFASIDSKLDKSTTLKYCVPEGTVYQLPMSGLGNYKMTSLPVKHVAESIPQINWEIWEGNVCIKSGNAFVGINKATSSLTYDGDQEINVEQYGDDKTIEVNYNGDGELDNWGEYDKEHINEIIEQSPSPGLETHKYIVKIKHNQSLDTPIFTIQLGVKPGTEQDYILDNNLEIGFNIVEDKHIIVNNCVATYDKKSHWASITSELEHNSVLKYNIPGDVPVYEQEMSSKGNYDMLFLSATHVIESKPQINWEIWDGDVCIKSGNASVKINKATSHINIDTSNLVAVGMVDPVIYIDYSGDGQIDMHANPINYFKGFKAVEGSSGVYQILIDWDKTQRPKSSIRVDVKDNTESDYCWDGNDAKFILWAYPEQPKAINPINYEEEYDRQEHFAQIHCMHDNVYFEYKKQGESEYYTRKLSKSLEPITLEYISATNVSDSTTIEWSASYKNDAGQDVSESGTVSITINKAKPLLSINPSSVKFAENDKGICTFEYTGDVETYSYTLDDTLKDKLQLEADFSTQSITFNSIGTHAKGNVTFKVDEGDNYQEASATVSVNILMKLNVDALDVDIEYDGAWHFGQLVVKNASNVRVEYCKEDESQWHSGTTGEQGTIFNLDGIVFSRYTEEPVEILFKLTKEDCADYEGTVTVNINKASVDFEVIEKQITIGETKTAEIEWTTFGRSFDCVAKSEVGKAYSSYGETYVTDDNKIFAHALGEHKDQFFVNVWLESNNDNYYDTDKITVEFDIIYVPPIDEVHLSKTNYDFYFNNNNPNCVFTEETTVEIISQDGDFSDDDIEIFTTDKPNVDISLNNKVMSIKAKKPGLAVYTIKISPQFFRDYYLYLTLDVNYFAYEKLKDVNAANANLVSVAQYIGDENLENYSVPNTIKDQSEKEYKVVQLGNNTDPIFRGNYFTKELKCENAEIDKIANYAFQITSNNSSPNYISDIDNVSSLGVHAFSNNTSIKSLWADDDSSVVFPESLTYVGDFAMFGCAQFRTIDMSKATRLTEIRQYSFYGIESNFIMHDNFSSIQPFAFTASNNYVSGVYYDSNKQYVLATNYGMLPSRLYLPASLITISERAFYECEKLERVVIGKDNDSVNWTGNESINLKYVNNLALYSCANLKFFIIGGQKSSKISYGYNVFSFCGKNLPTYSQVIFAGDSKSSFKNTGMPFSYKIFDEFLVCNSWSDLISSYKSNDVYILMNYSPTQINANKCVYISGSKVYFDINGCNIKANTQLFNVGTSGELYIDDTSEAKTGEFCGYEYEYTVDHFKGGLVVGSMGSNVYLLAGKYHNFTSGSNPDLQGGVVGVEYNAKLHCYDVEMYSNSAYEGGCIYGDWDSTINIYGGNFHNNNAFSGGAICSYSILNIDGTDNDVIIENNQAKNSLGSFSEEQSDDYNKIEKGTGGAIALHKSDETTSTPHAIKNCKFNNDIADNSGGAIWTSGDALNVDVENAEFKANRANNNGGAIASNCNFNLFSCYLEGNVANNYGGTINAAGDCYLSCDACTFINSTAEDEEGGAIKTDGPTSLRLSNKCFFNNINAGDDGGAIYCGKDFICSDCTIQNCKADGNGGGVVLQGWKNEVFNLTVTSCKAGGAGGGVWTSNDSGLLLYESTFKDNESGGDGGGLYDGSAGTNRIKTINHCFFENNRSTGAYGGAIRTESGSVEIHGSTFNSNYSECGGAIYGDTGGKITIKDDVEGQYSSFSNNFTDGKVGSSNTQGNGGAITAESDLFITGYNSANPILFSDNHVNYAGKSGGAICIWRPSFRESTFTNCRFENNSTRVDTEGSYGGAIFVHGEWEAAYPYLKCHHCVFVNNNDYDYQYNPNRGALFINKGKKPFDYEYAHIYIEEGCWGQTEVKNQDYN